MASSDRINDEEEQFTQAFGEHLTNISQQRRSEIQMIKNNDPNVTAFDVRRNLADCLSDLAWELLGRYIANNDYLEEVDLEGINLTDELMEILFNSLVKSSSLKVLLLFDNMVSMNGIRNMVPFLRNASTLSEINLSGNRNIKTEGFEVLINALDGGPIEELILNRCNIEDISALEHCTLPHLRELHLINNHIQSMGGKSALNKFTNLKQLHLEDNNIGREGCIVICNLLQNEDSRLEILDLDSNDVCDEGAEILAASLKHNNSLTSLYLKGNNINEKGYLAFLKLLNDVSSIESTCNSNHTLKIISLPDYDHYTQTVREMRTHILSLLYKNRSSPNPGREKIIDTHLNSNKRMELSRLQGVPYSYSSIFSDIDAFVLPEVLALVGQSHGQTELYRMLIAVVPDLASTVNRKVILQQKYAEKTAQMEALRAEMIEINNELALIALKEGNQSAVSGDSKMCGKKRERSANL